jgi:signal transduction histidine kinase
MPTTPTSRSGIRLAALRVPLATKIAGANLAAVVILGWLWLRGGASITAGAIGILCIVLAIHGVLIAIALRPIRDLEMVASRVWRGDFGARVERSAVADQQVMRIGAMFNTLLDGLAADRARMRALAIEVIEVADRERAGLARELHDSTAQRLAAVLMQLSVAARQCPDPDLATRLGETRDAVEGILDEVRLLSHTIHPHLLDELGLVAALRRLARESSIDGVMNVEVQPPDDEAEFPAPIASVLYRVAQEAVSNASRHAAPRLVEIIPSIGPTSAGIVIRDDGRGFDLAEAEHRRPGMGLFSMRERVALVDGNLEILSAIGKGTTVAAIIPLTAATNPEPGERR